MLRSLDLPRLPCRRPRAAVHQGYGGGQNGTETGILDLYLRDATDETLKAGCRVAKAAVCCWPIRNAATLAMRLSSRRVRCLICRLLPMGRARDANVFGVCADDTCGLPIKRLLSRGKPRAYRPDDEELGIPVGLGRNEVPLPQQNWQKLTEYRWDDPSRTDADLKTIEDHPDIESLFLQTRK